jgi:hypothetical protein
MVALMLEFPTGARRADRVLCPTQKHRCLGDVERPCAVLEHLWNTNVVHAWGPLVMAGLGGCLATRMNWLGW